MDYTLFQGLKHPLKQCFLLYSFLLGGENDIADLLKCSGLFSAEDMDRIMAAYEKQKIAEQREKKIEDEMEDALVDRAS